MRLFGRLPIRYKMLAVFASILWLALGGYAFWVVRLFRTDKIAYIFDQNAVLVQHLAEETRTYLHGLRGWLELFELENKRATTPDQNRFVDRLFQSQPDLLQVRIYRLQPWSLAREFVNPNIENKSYFGALKTSREDEQNLLGVAQSSKPNQLRILNMSVPPDVPLLGLVDGAVAQNTVVVSILRADWFLKMFGKSAQHQSYITDTDGNILVHPMRDMMMDKGEVSDAPLFESAATARVDSGGLEFEANTQTLLGAYAKLKEFDLLVFTEIPKSRALRTTHEVAWRSGLFALATVLTAFLVSVVLARRLVSPLERLRQAVDEFGRGNFDVRIGAVDGDEIGELAESFEKMGKSLREAQTHLVQSEKLVAFGQLGAGIAHEIRNPMTGIISFAQLAQSKIDQPQKAVELIKMVEMEAQRCRDILSSFLKFTRPENNDFRKVHPREFIEAAVRLVQHQFQLNHIALKITVSDALPYIRGNAPELQQTMLNLLMNAQQAMPEGGLVHVAAGVQDGRVLIHVSDTGPGIADEMKGRIFEPFFTTKPAGEGTGLGLAISRSIAQAHGGDIYVVSHAGPGATFTLDLPAHISTQKLEPLQSLA